MNISKHMYCPCCDKDVNYLITNEKQLYEDKKENISFTFNGRVAKCCNCGEELYVKEVSEYNQKKFEEEYRKANKIISVDEIKQMMIKYQIGKRPLSLILGFGEITITRYLDGYIPSPKNSKIIKRYLDKPEDYYSLLLTYKDLITDVAYRKSKKATEELLVPGKEDIILNDVSNYIVSKIEVTPLSLQKILYYIQIFCLIFFKEPLFHSPIKAWEHGPVFSKIYFKYHDYKYNIILPKQKDIIINLSEEKSELINAVIKYFGCYNGNVLRQFTHSETPWAETDINKVISKAQLLKFANSIKEKHNIKTIDDIAKYSNYKFKIYLNNYFN